MPETAAATLEPPAVSLEGWLKRFRSTRPSGWDSQALFRYRCTAAEYNELIELLTRNRVPDENDRAFWCGFFLLAAEWFRREFVGGHWKWEPILSRIGLEDISQSPEFRGYLQRAMLYWNISIIKYGGERQFLSTAVREGGLPVAYLASDESQSRGLARLLEALVKARIIDSAVDLHVAAADRSSHLPARLRDQGLLANLVELAELLAAQREQLEAESFDEVRFIQDHADKLPFLLDDESARGFAQRFVQAGRAAARDASTAPLRSTLSLTERGGRYSLQRTIRVPRLTTAALLGFKEGIERARLYVVLADGNRFHLADAVVNGEALELVPRGEERRVILPFDFSANDLLLVASKGTRDIGDAPFASPSDLPWVFAETDGAWTLIGEGSRRASAQSLRVLARKGDPPEAEGSCRVLQDDLAGRRLFEVSGRVRFGEGIDACDVVARADADDGQIEFLLRGRRTQIASTEFFDGPPRVQRRIDNVTSSVKPAWRPDGYGQREVALDSSSVGDGFIVVRENGRLLDRKPASILPSGAAARLEPSPSGGHIRLDGFGDATVRCDQGTTTRTGTVIDIGFSKDDAREEVEFDIAWSLRGATKLSLPFPRRSARFVHVDGRVLPNGAVVAIDRIGRISALVIRPDAEHRERYELQARFEHGQAPMDAAVDLSAWRPAIPLASAEDRHHFDLRELDEAFRLAFSSARAHDASVQVTLRVRGEHRRLKVVRYDGALVLDAERQIVKAVEDTVDASSVDNLVVRAQQIWNPNAPEIELTLLASGVWSLQDERLVGGPWLLAAYDGSVCRYRPIRYSSPLPPGEVPSGVQPGSLGSAICAEGRDRAALLDAVLKRLERDPSDGDWEILLQFISLSAQLPANTFDAVVRAIRFPLVCARAVFATEGEHRRRLVNALEQLPFMWHLIPARVWDDVVSETYRGRQRLRAQKIDILKAAERDPEGMGIPSAEEEMCAIERDVRRYSTSLAACIRLPLADRGLVSDFVQQPETDAENWQRILRLAVTLETAPSEPLEKIAERIRRKEPRTGLFLRVPDSVQPGLSGLWLAPRLAAFASILGHHLPEVDVFCLRIARSLDEDAFDALYEATLNSTSAAVPLSAWENP